MIERYRTKKMEKVWSEEFKYKTWLKIELLTYEAFTKIGTIKEKDFILAKKTAKYNLKDIKNLEKIYKHDVVAFIRAVSKNMGSEGRWFHYGLTSSDLVDTGWSYMIMQANNILQEEFLVILDNLKKLALEHKMTYTVGRTHGIHAEVTTFGYKVAVWYNVMQRNFIRFLSSRSRIEIGIISGSVGNYCNVDPFIQDFVCDNLLLSSSQISTQILERDRHSEYIATLALIASGIEQIALEIRLLQQTEIGEVQEPFDKDQIGSSSMPHKKNPILSENICGLSRAIRGYINPAFENNCLWHERDISHSSVERVIIPDCCTLLHFMMLRINYILENFTVNKERMLSNIYLTNKTIFSQRVLLLLIEKLNWSREKAHKVCEELSIKAIKENIDFEKLLEKELKLNKNLLKEAFSLQYYTKNIDLIFKRLNLIS
ncbi:adenylosuccinate lyase [symbiont of Argiope bruennichi]|uniref:adenylosuccinate lyase n=1 Tax=symbiont of Argiope bruennichi TaxID=2810479 RepID=UPI003DA4317B